MKRKKRANALAFLLLALAAASVCIFIMSGNLNTESAAASVPTASPPSMSDFVSAQVSGIDDTHFLELINGDYAVNGDSGETVSAWPTAPVSGSGVTLNETALDAVGKMFDAARTAGIGSLFISSGYRDYAEQEQTYDDAADKSYVQPPGHSEHETGLAADIMAVGFTGNTFAVSAPGKWLADNSWKYGFILRYPQGKQDITGIAYEPWHFRYVGLPHAYYCHENNLCLEEYLRFLKDGGGYEITLDGKNYSVFYEAPRDGIIEVPKSSPYEISDDNTGGYVITVWSD